MAERRNVRATRKPRKPEAARDADEELAEEPDDELAEDEAPEDDEDEAPEDVADDEYAEEPDDAVTDADEEDDIEDEPDDEAADDEDDPEPLGGEDDTADRSRARRRRNGVTAAKAAQAALRQIAELTGKPPEGITGVEPSDDGWIVGVEVVEDRRIPSSTDILATYETEIDGEGDLMSYRRVRRYSRGRGDDGDT